MKIIVVLIACLTFLSCSNENEKAANNSTQDKREIKEIVDYYPDGKKKIEGKEVNGQRHGVWKYYYENGYMWSEGEYWYGVRKGFSIVYYKNGRKKMEGNYKDGLKVGKWKLWNEDGSLNKEINMDELLSKEDSLKLGL